MKGWIRFIYLLWIIPLYGFYWTEDYLIPMRDGIELYTVVFIPYHFPFEKKSATILIRTPYGTNGLKGEGEIYVNQGYNVAMQDFRGRYQSQGQFEMWLNASNDAYDTMAWIIQQKWSNGRIFATGASANGIAAYLQPLDSPPWLFSQFIIAGTAELYTTIFQGGAFRHSLIDGWLAAEKEPQWSAIVRQQEQYSSFWNNVQETGKWSNVNFPAVHLTGWYDIFNQQQLDAFEGYQIHGGPLSRGNNFLIVVPTGHCAGGQVPWPHGLDGIALAQALALELFKLLADDDRNLEKNNPLQGLPHMYWYVMGPANETLGNYWTASDNWPAPTSTSFYFSTGGKLKQSPPTSSQGQSFIYDPSNPVPTLGGNNLLLPKCGPQDQSQLETRPDVITFTSDVLTNDLAVNGHMKAILYVSSNATDTDFTVKITDVYPNGVSMLLQDGIIRMRWRDGPTKMNLMTPGQIYKVEVDVWSTSFIFNRGHRIRVAISSSNSPRFSVNPNNGLPLSKNGPQLIAQNTIYFNSTFPSQIILPVVSISDLPPFNFTIPQKQMWHTNSYYSVFDEQIWKKYAKN